MTTATIESRPADLLFKTLYRLVSDFERSQSSIRRRLIQIKRGQLDRERTPTRVLMNDRDLARDNLRGFLDDLTDDECSMFAVAWGNREWRSTFDEKLDPKHDPSP